MLKRGICDSFFPSRVGIDCGRREKQRGFTFAEVLAALVFVAILIPVTIQGISIANRAGSVAEHSKIAAQLATRILNQMVITNQWSDGDKEGNFEEPWSGYRWILKDEAWETDSMHLLTVYVWFVVQDREMNVRLSTLVQEIESTETESESASSS